MQFTRKVYDALLAYGPKRLIRGDYTVITDGERSHCAVGVAFPSIWDRQHAVAVYGSSQNSYANVLRERDSIINENDSFFGTEEERYLHMLGWLRNELGLTEMEPMPEKESVTTG